MIIDKAMISKLCEVRVKDPDLYKFIIQFISPRKETSFMKGIPYPKYGFVLNRIRTHIKFKVRYRGPRHTYFAGHCLKAHANKVALYLK